MSFGSSTREVGVKIDVDADTSGASSKLSKFGGIAKAAALGAAAVGAAAVVVGAKLFEMGDRADDANASLRQGAETMGLFGDKADDVANRLINYANKQALVNGVDQNTIKATQAKLLTFNHLADSADKMGGNFDRATIAAIDMAAKGFGTAEGNAVQLGKALNDPITGLAALKKSGIDFTESEKQRIATLVESNRMGEAQALVLKAIETQVGGTAEAMSGGFDRMKIKFSQVGEELGLKLLPYVDAFGNLVVDKLIPGTSDLVHNLADRFGPTLRKVAGFIQDDVVPAAKEFYHWFVDEIAPGIVKLVQPRIEAFRDNIDKVRDALRDNKPEIDKLITGLKNVAEWTAEHVLPKLGTLIGFIDGKFGDGIVNMIKLIAGVVDAFQAVIDTVQHAIDKTKELFGLQGPNVQAPGPLSQLPGDQGPPTTGGSTFAGRGYVDARTYVTVDGSGIVDENKVAQALAPILDRHRLRLGLAV